MGERMSAALFESRERIVLEEHAVPARGPGGNERIRKRIELVRYVPLDLTPLITHRFSLGEIEDVHQLFGNRGDGAVNAAAAR